MINRSRLENQSPHSTVPGLACTNGELRGRRYLLDKDVIRLVRTAANDIQLDNPHVSRHHASIIKKKQSYRIRDPDSQR